MYHPALIARRAEQTWTGSAFLQHTFPHGLPDWSVADTQALSARLVPLRDPETGQLRRPLTQTEADFLIATRVRVVYDAPYFCEAFVAIDQEGHGLRPLFPLWASQHFVLERLAALELAHDETGNTDGLLLNVLKARQLGVSTLAEALLAHRILTRGHVRALAGADVEPQAGYLFRMVDRVYQHLPWFLQPDRLNFLRDREMSFRNGSTLRTAWGKSTRGELQATTGRQKGHIGRGATYGAVHISELSTWDNPGQLDDALLPAIPLDPDVLVLFESTAKGAGNWWHHHWLASDDGVGRFHNVFIPWGIEPEKYSRPAPLDWSPAETTRAQARKAEAVWPLYLGHGITLTRDQLYWYETTRAFYQKKGDLGKFLEEYASDPAECFQYSGRSVFTLEQLEAIDAQARPLIDVWAVEPARDIAELRRLPDPAPDPRPRPRVSMSVPPSVADTLPVPPGYGFERLGPDALRDLASLRAGVLAIWEYPRSRGRRRYVMAVDVGDGVDLDYSVVSVFRLPTVEEPAEEVAQYVSATISPAALGRVADAIGRLYTDADGVEALAAVECNLGPGIATQNELQLHLGYTHFYVWETLDAGSPDARYTTRIGWATTSRTRPIILVRLHEALTTADPITGVLDLRLNSPITRGELRHLVIPPEPGARLGDAAAAPGHYDDAIMAAAIGYFVAYMLAGGEVEPISERRRRRAAETAWIAAQAGRQRADARNTATTAQEAQEHRDADADETDDRSGISLALDDRAWDA